MISEPHEAPSAFHEAKEASISGKLIVEEFMKGPELSLDALVFDGRIQVTGIADRIIERAPYFVEVGHTLPSNQLQEKQDQAVELFRPLSEPCSGGIHFSSAPTYVGRSGLSILVLASSYS